MHNGCTQAMSLRAGASFIATLGWAIRAVVEELQTERAKLERGRSGEENTQDHDDNTSTTTPARRGYGPLMELSRERLSLVF